MSDFKLRQDFPPLELGRREPYILQRVAGQRVLDLGFVDWPITQERIDSGKLLHFEIIKRAKAVVGVDQDASVRHAFPPDSDTYRLFFGNVEDPATFAPIKDAGLELDLVLAGEILEHLNNPGLFFDAIRTVMSEHTTLLITVPNGLRGINHGYTQQGIEWVHPDHNYWYSPHTIQTLCNKNGFHVDFLRGYTYGSETPQVLGPSGLGCPGLICEASLARPGEALRRWPAAPKPRPVGVDLPKVLCITDTRGWAYENIVHALQQTIGDRYELTAIPYNEFGKLGANAVRQAALDADAVYCFSAVMPDEAYDLLGVRPMVAGIHNDHQLTTHADKLTPDRLERFLAVGCLNQTLAARAEAAGLHRRIMVTQNGVDARQFRPRGQRRGPVRCGWAGFAGHTNGTVKRFRELVVPGCYQAGVPLLAAIRELNPVPRHEMPAYFNLVDLLLIASTGEGTSGPLLEAGACGCAMVSTRVGAAEQLIDHGVNGFLVDGTVEDIAETLYWCRTHPDETRNMGRAARETVRKHWSWEVRAEEYAALFDVALEKAEKQENRKAGNEEGADVVGRVGGEGPMPLKGAS